MSLIDSLPRTFKLVGWPSSAAVDIEQVLIDCVWTFFVGPVVIPEEFGSLLELLRYVAMIAASSRDKSITGAL